MKRVIGAVGAILLAVAPTTTSRAGEIIVLRSSRDGRLLSGAVSPGQLAMVAVGSETQSSPTGGGEGGKDPKAILDKAIKALGGEEKLKKAEAISWKTKGTITFNGNENEIKTHATVQGLDHYRRESEAEFNGEPRKFIVVVSGQKGWRKFGEEPMEMDDDRLANEKRNIYLEVLPATLVPLKGKDYKLEAAGEQSVDGKPAVGIKVTGPDQKDFTLYFDKDSGLPVKLVAKVVGFQGNEHTQETTFKDYKDFDGIKKATKVENKRDGEDFLKSEVTEFKVLDKVEPSTFSEPS